MSEPTAPKGVKTKLFGVSLIILSSLNLMVSWRGSLDVNMWQVLILGVGIALFALGAAHSSSSSKTADDEAQSQF